tara:strand:+ start:303 stop:515 length:213 start_codon:yes stop_codon:yes gene_type:complete
MKSPKKRSLNELRQTKDSYYVVPKAKSNTSLKNLLEEYFASKNESLNAENIDNFIDHLCSNGYKFRITGS